MVVTPRVTLAGSAFHSIQKVTKDEVTRIIPRKCMFIDPRKCFDHINIITDLKRVTFIDVNKCFDIFYLA